MTVQDLAPCKKLLRFEVDAGAVDEAFAKTAKEFQRHAEVAGFRAGKAPLEMVLKRYDKEIQEEVKRKLIATTYQEGIKQEHLNVVNLLGVEEIQFGHNQALQFAATVETAPVFPLPDYRGLPAQREVALVSDADIDRALDALRGHRATFQKVDRAAQLGDIVVINYQGTCEGKPITEWAPVARGLTEKKNFWVQVSEDAFIPGFAPQLVGAKAGEKRTVAVDFGPDFVTKEVAGKKGVYEVELVEVKERVLPPVDDALARAYEAESLEKLREGVRRDLQNELNQRQKRSIRNQLIRALLSRIEFDLPESYVQHETRTVVYDIVAENQKRGVAKEVIEQQKEQIYSAATQSARERVKANYLFGRIAEKEGIRVLPEELHARIVTLAHAYQMPVDKLRKELEKRDGLSEVAMQVLHEKVVDFLHEHAKIEDVAAAPVAPA